ncbi:MAG: META domain-containing protein [Phycisphaeraceae bacterium]|nr:META domain-containing protein [Phycisphaeraceae bacterium]
MKYLVAALMTLLSMAVVSGCESAPEKISGGPDAIRSLLGNWTLDSIGDKSFAMLVPQDAAAKKPTLDISADGKVSGFAGVNRMMSSLNLDAISKGDFKLAPAGTTMMAGPEYAMKLEREYLDALAKVRNFRVDGSKLTLTDGATQIMQFVRGG